MLCSLLKSHRQFGTCLKEGEAKYVDLILFRCNYMVMETCWRSSLSCFFRLSTLFRIKGFEKFIIASVVRTILLSSRCGHNVRTLRKHTQYLIFSHSISLFSAPFTWLIHQCWYMLAKNKSRKYQSQFLFTGFLQYPHNYTLWSAGTRVSVRTDPPAAPCPVSLPREGDLTQNRQTQHKAARI